MTRLNVGCDWAVGRVSYERLIWQCVEFARRLQAIHPLFVEISPRGNKSFFANMLKQPLVWGIDEAAWRAMFDRSMKKYDFVSIGFWNRHPSKSEFAEYTIHANDVGLGNGVAVNGLPNALNRPEHLNAIVKALIEVFAPNQADVYTYWPDDVIPARHWLLWLREGHPWPHGPKNRFQAAQGPHDTEEPWLGGTLYTWRQYEPWRYRAAS